MLGRRARGVSLVELIVAMGIGLIVMGAAYATYYRFVQADDYEARRESMAITTRNLMGRVKQDIRAASSARGSGGALTLTVRGKRIVYRNAPAGVERVANGARWMIAGVNASFQSVGRGVRVSIRAGRTAQRRPIRFDVTSYIVPRN